MSTTYEYELTGADIERVTGMSRKTVHGWKRRGILKPGPNRKYRVRDLFSVGIGRDLRGRGFSVVQSGKAIDWLAARSIDELRAQWAGGRRYLLIVGDSLPHSRLLSKDETLAAAAVAIDIGNSAPMAFIDTEGAYNRLIGIMKTRDVERSRSREQEQEEAACQA